MKNYYEILGISADADTETIIKAIKDQRRHWNTRSNHPDDEKRRKAEEMVASISEAERILLDKAEREKYDAELVQSAERNSSAASGNNSPHGEKWLDAVKYYFARGEYSSMLQAAREAVNCLPDNPMAWYYKAFAECNNNLYADADFSYNEAIRMYPDKTPALFLDDYGDLCFKCGNYQKALQYYIQARKSDPSYYKDDSFTYKRCICLHCMNEYEIATPIYTDFYNKHGGEEGVADNYARFVFDMILNAWSCNRNGARLITNYRQLCFSKEWMSVLVTINVTDESLKNDINIMLREIQDAERITTATDSGALGGLLDYGLIVGAVHALNQKPNWQWTREALSPEELSTGLQ